MKSINEIFCLMNVLMYLDYGIQSSFLNLFFFKKRIMQRAVELFLFIANIRNNLYKAFYGLSLFCISSNHRHDREMCQLYK